MTCIAESAEGDLNVDLIERQAAIELVHSLYPSAPIMKRNREWWEEKYKPFIETEKALEKLPSAQPDLCLATDCISREEAYKVLTDYYHHTTDVQHKALRDALSRVPSAQSELEDKIRAIGYTGKEGRIYIGGRLFAVRELPQ